MLFKCQRLPPSLCFSPPHLLNDPGHSYCYSMHRERKPQQLLLLIWAPVLLCGLSRTTKRSTQVKKHLQAKSSGVLWTKASYSKHLQLPRVFLGHRCPRSEVHGKKGGQFIISIEKRMLLLSGANVAIFAAEVMHHHAIGIPGKRTVSYFLLADSAGLLFCNDTFNLLVEDPLLLHPEEFGLQ